MRTINWAWAALRKPPVSWIVRFAVAAGLMGLLAAFVDFPAAVEAVGDVNLLLFLAALALAVGAWLVNSVKWWLLLEPLAPGSSLLRLYAWNLRAIFYGHLLPGFLAGEAVKGYRLYRETGSAGPVAVSIGADKLTGLAALALLGSLALMRSPELRGNDIYIVLVGGVGILLPTVLLALFIPSAVGWIRKLQRYPLLEGLVGRGVEVIEPYQGRYLLLLATLLLALIFHALGATVIYLLARATHIDVGFIDFLWVYAAVSLVRALPISFAGLGVREAAFVVLLRPLGVGSEAALTLGLLALATQLAMALLGGGLELKAAIWPPSGAATPPRSALLAQSEGVQGWSRDA